MAEVTTDAAVRRGFSANPVDELIQSGQQPVVGVPARIVVPLRLRCRTRERSSRPPASAADLCRPLRPGGVGVHSGRRAGAPRRGGRASRRHGTRARSALHRGACTEPRQGNLTQLPREPQRSVPGTPDPQPAGAQRRCDRSTGAEPGAQPERLSLICGRGRRAGPRGQPEGAPARGTVDEPSGGQRWRLSELRDDVGATRSSIDGYWLNVPGRGARCPTCNAAQPEIAIDLTLAP